MTLLLTVVIGAMLWLGYRLVYTSVVASELTRLEAASNQVATALQTSMRRVQRENVLIAARPELARAVSGLANGSDQASARRVLAAELDRLPQVRAIALWSTQGKLVLVEGSRALAERNPPRLIESESSRTSEGAELGPLSASRDTVLYPMFSPVKGSVGDTIGYLAVTRRMTTTTESAALLAGLVGKAARVRLGNLSGDFWSDFAKPVAGPASALEVGASGEYLDRQKVTHLFASSVVPDAPWQVLVVLQREEAVAVARQFVWKMLAIAALFVIVGGVLAWTLVGHSLRPLTEVTSAAEGLARGDYSRRVRVDGDDELGRLGESFNEMAGRVENASAELAARARMLEMTNTDLQQSEQRHRELIEHSPNGIVVHRDRIITFANPAAAKILGVSNPQQLLGRSVLEFVDPSDRETVADRAAQVQRDGSSVPAFEVTLTRADKKRVAFEVLSNPVVMDDVTAVQTIMRDVTEQRVLEDQLRQAQKMDAVGRLAGGIAHDFNNLLTVIQAHAEFALGDEKAEDRQADIEEIRRASDSAARLTRQLLTFSRKQVIVPSHIDLNAAIEGMLGMLSRLIGDNIEVVTVAGKNLAGIWADPGQLEQVLLNLAINARDAMPDGGVLRFETANVTIGEGTAGASGDSIPPGDYVMLEVQDTGAGMTEDVQAHVFEPFYTTKQASRGTGLGLSTVYGIVRQSNGYIWLYSEVGRGTRFKILFPPHQQGADRTSPVSVAEPRASGVSAHVLVVEDDPSVRSAIRRALTSAKFTVAEARDVTEAKHILQTDRAIDLVITDMVMPGPSGADLVSDIARTHPTMPVIIMSGYSEETASRQWRVPANATFLEKPVSPVALVRLIERLLANRV